MTFDDLLCTHPSANTLEQFSARFFEALGISDISERESSNYVEEKYFEGVFGDVVANVSWADIHDHNDLPYLVSMSSRTLDQDALEAQVDIFVRTQLLPNGFKVARMYNFGRLSDERRADY